MSNSKTNQTSKSKTAEKEIEKLQAELRAKIEAFNLKSKQIKNREKFIKTKNSLQEFITEMGTDFDDMLTDNTHRVVFLSKHEYRIDDGIKIDNNLLVREFAQFLIQKIDDKLSEIESEIMN